MAKYSSLKAGARTKRFGIEFAIVSYVLIKILSGRAKDVSWLMAALAVIFVVKEALS